MNILSNYAGRVVGMLIGFFLVPFLVLKLGKEVFGLIVVFEGLMVFVEAMSTSIRVALSQNATFALSSGNKEEFIGYMSTGRGIFFVLSGIVFVAGLIISSFIPVIFRIPEAYHQDSHVFFMLLTCSFAISIPNVVYWAGLYAKQRFDLINLASSAGIIIRGIAIFALFSILPAKNLTLVTYGLISLIMTWTQNFAIYLAYKKVLAEFRINLKHFNLKKVRQILSFSFYAMTGHLSSVFHDNAINWMVNRLWGPAYNAMYGIGVKFGGLIEKIFMEPTWTLTPTFTDLLAKKENDRLKQFIYVYSKVMGMLVIPICLALMAFSQSIIHSWVGDGFSDSATMMFIGLMGQMVYIPVAACLNIPYAIGKVKIPGILSPIFSMMSLTLCYVFSVHMQMGLKGMAVGTSIACTVYTIIFSVPYSLKIIGFSVREYWVESYIKPLFWALIYWGAVLFGIHWFHKGFILSVMPIVTLFLCAPVYFLGVYWLVLNARDKVYVHQALAALSQKFSIKIKNAS